MRERESDLLVEENRRIRTFRLLVDLTIGEIYQDPSMKLEDARKRVEELRSLAGSMFPDKKGTFDLVLWPRFDRVVRERFGKGLASAIH